MTISAAAEEETAECGGKRRLLDAEGFDGLRFEPLGHELNAATLDLLIEMIDDGDSLRGYVDGREVKGVWDMGGKSDLPPVNDADDVVIGTGNGGGAGNASSGSDPNPGTPQAGQAS